MGPLRRCFAALASLAALVAVVAQTACAPVPLGAGIPVEWRGSPNFGERKPQYVIIHYTGSDRVESALNTLTSREREVSAHYLIARSGRILQLVDERARAWHAGDSRWGADTDINSASLGIELDNNGREPFADAQIASLLRLLTDIAARYRIPAANYLGHSDVAPARKVDPGRLFPWRTLAQRGFGIWCDPPFAAPANPLDLFAGLRMLGYDTTDPVAALRAFSLHFMPDESAVTSAENTRALLSCLVNASQVTPPSP